MDIYAPKTEVFIVFSVIKTTLTKGEQTHESAAQTIGTSHKPH